MRSNREWVFWGKADPLWAVNSIRGKERGASSAWTEEDFLQSGTAYFDDVRRQWQNYGIGSTHCVEIGCGSGRITNQLLTVFDKVTALDVSPDQLETARRLLGSRAERVNFVLVETAQVPIEAGLIDGMFSCEVFQHFSDFSGIELYLRAVFLKLKPGGTICFQIPVSGLHGYGTFRYLVKRAAIAVKRVAHVRAIMDYHFYPAARIFKTLRSIGYKDCEMRMFPLADHEDGHAYFFARK